MYNFSIIFVYHTTVQVCVAQLFAAAAYLTGIKEKLSNRLQLVCIRSMHARVRVDGKVYS